MKKKSKLWLYFTVATFVVILITALVMFFTTIILFHKEQFRMYERSWFFPVIILLLISIAIGSVISFLVGAKILKPITKISEASNEVAKGNFDIRLEENSTIAELYNLSINFNKMVQDLSSIETLRTDFVVNVSHEFKTPIAAIEGYATLLQDKNLSEAEQHDYTKMILESTRQLSCLIGNVLKLSKLENREVIIKKESYRLDEQIRQAILLLENEWSKKNLDMQINLEKLTYEGNPDMLMQVWLNILNNAIKFTPLSGVISVRLFSRSSSIVIEISDNGCGIKADDISHIFTKFYQEDSARKSEGNGLGLALVKRIIEICKGSIEVQSEENKGSIFIIMLPVNP